LKRLDHLEHKGHRIDQLEFDIDELKKINVELKIEVDLLKKKNVELEKKLESIITTPTGNTGNHLSSAVAAGNGKAFLPRSCYELKATNGPYQCSFWTLLHRS